MYWTTRPTHFNHMSNLTFWRCFIPFVSAKYQSCNKPCSLKAAP
jgi:hypothetical protein